ncbi:MAG: hypothetical protein GKR89_24355 [Candidatus Latescibacteria bacterium]|nr:hypothetical protein [Candidatus Latescibacterota bacterium]
MPLTMPPDLVKHLRYDSEAYIRYKTILHIVGKAPDSKEIRIVRDEVKDTVLVKTLLAEQRPNGRIELDPYDKWRGAHWILAVLADLGYPRGDAALIPLRQQVYDWLFSDQRAQVIAQRLVADRHRWHASQEGNALYYLHQLGLADERTDQLAQRLYQWQWPDGGWNCDMKSKAATSSFTETLLPLRGLTYHAHFAASAQARAAAEEAAEVFLQRQLYKRRRDGKVIKSEFTALHYPCYWHYDILFALKVMAEAGYIGDPRCAEALDLLAAKQLPEGGFAAEKKYYRVDKDTDNASLVDWGGTGKKKMNPFITADACHVLNAAGRLEVHLR